MKTTLKLAALIGSLFVAATAVTAIPINGSIAFNGSLTLDDPIPGAPTEFISISGVEVSVGTQTGDYLGTGGTTGVSMLPFGFDPFSGPIMNIWSFVLGPTSYSFDLDSVDSVAVLPLGNGLFQLAVAGSGMAYITGFDPTPGAFSITTTGNAAQKDLGFGAFAFAADDPMTVPDQGSTAILLGLALGGFAILSVSRSKRFES